jgi:inosine-uridine nucleoside N-ribohydrolase
MRSLYRYAGVLLGSLLPEIALSATSSHYDGLPPRPKVILDNDWSSTGFIPYLQALKAGWEVVGLISDTSDSWSLQCGMHALATLEIGNLDCIPVYRGADYPILRRPESFSVWEMMHGVLPWQGAFASENTTNELLGNNPTSGNPDRIVRSAFIEGYPNTTFASDISGAEFLVQQVRKFPGQISIYSAGALTNIALAVRMDPSFAKNAKELVIMGGYVDVNLLQTTGSVLLADLQSDINLIIDPEGAKMALSADWRNITIVSNAANQVMSTQDFLEEVHQVKTPYSELMFNHYGTEFPFWDETAAAVMLEPSIVRNSTRFYVDVDTSFGSPNYGNIRAYQQALAPRGQQLQEVNFVIEIDGDALKRRIKESVQYSPAVCPGF